ncbi:hypothetical protein B9Z65_4150 [Elsinoe australis]|uniref:Uncharacterized protein n=1 Tax=Elsinoe australis TaxID=40998 RepID=A0A2P7Z200_9PEZI|nr:hypothetical protein B9Z65_4150 [Elsinoe australis]
MFNSTSVTTVVVANNPPQSPGRKPSVFEAMFDNFKFGAKKEEDEHSGSSDGGMDEKTHDRQNVKYHPQEVTSPFSINETKPLEEPKRSLSVAFAEVFRRPSETSSKSRSSSPQRKASTSSSAGRKLSFFQSSNPDPDNDVPRNASIHSQHSSTGNNESADQLRKGSYVPRNASNSFLKSASVLTPEERVKRADEVLEAKRTQSISAASAAAAARKASLALSDTSEASAATSGRRPSGMVPGNIAARYMRSASLTEEEREQMPGARRRSTKSRQNSNGEGATVKPVALAPEQFQQWQNSVNKSRVGGSFSKPGETSGATRMHSLAGIADIAEGGEQEEDVAPRSHSSSTAPIVAITPASPAGSQRKKKSFSIDTNKANTNPKSGANRMDSARDAYLADQISPKGATFGMTIMATTGNSITGRTSGPTSPQENEALESLGFRGAVPA